jgi:hypothetical protein
MRDIKREKAFKTVHTMHPACALPSAFLPVNQ